MSDSKFEPKPAMWSRVEPSLERPAGERREEVATYQATIFVAGDEAKARRICQDHCDLVGLCVTIEPTTYVYTGGVEAGVRVGLIHYPRFPTTFAAIFGQAEALAMKLLDGLNQGSLSIVAADRTLWITRRPGDLDA